MGEARLRAMRPLLCVVVFVLGVAFVVLAAVALLEDQRYSPVYDDVVCRPEDIRMTDGQVTPTIKVTIEADILCWNPNPYDIVVTQDEVGRAYFGNTLLEIGNVSAQPATLPASPGKGLFSRKVVVMRGIGKVGLVHVWTVASSMLTGPFKLFFEVSLRVVASPSIFGMSSAKQEVRIQRNCGVTMQLVPELSAGEAACGLTDFGELAVPPIGNETAWEEAGPAPPQAGMQPQIDSRAVDDAQQSITALCVALATVGLVCGVPCVCGPILWAARSWALRANAAAKVTKVADASEPVTIAVDSATVAPDAPSPTTS
mmetsp:Transcript_71966/g.201969  ORF Transcript_71966/g.201969 Transcript_71966/m.201969 type:complete len:315 (+) Transcript_71966:90-1034(+)